jgi:dipeptidyl-peptidase 4
MKKFLCLILFLIPSLLMAQAIRWSADGNAYYRVESGELIAYSLPDQKRTVVLAKSDLTPSGETKPMTFRNYTFSPDGKQILLYTNTKKVWRLHTEGDYWVYNLGTKSLKKLGASLPASSLRFAKFSPDMQFAAYVSEFNLFVESLSDNSIKQITKDGSRKLINGTFDWVYEEEFSCRDGFQWSPDSKRISFWQLDARKIRDFYMINNTDSIYSKVIPVEYPKTGQRNFCAAT